MTAAIKMTEEKQEIPPRRSHCLLFIFFLLGVFLAASVGLAIALGLVRTNNTEHKEPAGTSQITTSARTETELENVCTSSSCVLRAGELLQAMDLDADPCTDFYQYSCGKWVRTHSIPDTASSYTRFGELRDSVRLELKGLLQTPYDSSTEGNSIRKLKNLYQSCLNETKLNELGTESLKQLVINMQTTWPLMSGGPSTTLDLETLIASTSVLLVSPLVELSVGADMLNSSAYILWVDQATLGIDRNYMVKGRNSSEVAAYEKFVVDLAVTILGLTDNAALREDVAKAVQFEVDVAKLTATKEQRRNMEHYYERMSVRDLQTAVPNLNWMKLLTTYLRPANLSEAFTEDTMVAVFAKDYLLAVLELYHLTDTRVVQNYFLLRILRGFHSFLNKDIRDLINPLRQVLYGVSQPEARWKQCVSTMAEVMPSATGLLYVKNYFTPAAKQKALEMVGYIRTSMKEMISGVSWMDLPTKNKALEKADAILELIGYPDYQFNNTILDKAYSLLDPMPDTYFQNRLELVRVSSKEDSEQLNSAPSRKSWSDAASTVNAFYWSTHNTITFPAGILQPPFYAEDFPMSMIFGGIGMVIGHEITHGFDDQGRKYDKEGNNQPWWSNSSVAEYQALTQCFVDQYSRQTIATGLHVNGRLTLGENIADNGGIKAAFKAFQMWQSKNKQQPALPGLGLTHKQLFFVNFAQGWCSLTMDEAARDSVMTDSHSPAEIRVRVSVANSPDFAETFQCHKDAPMNPIKKCLLW